MGVWQAAAEILGAVIGAGFASGREIDSFFARFGMWSWLGVGTAAVVIGCMGMKVTEHPEHGGIPPRWRHGPLEHVWRWTFALLLTFTGGAMLSGAGEIAALALRVHRARVWGMGATLAAAWGLSARESRALARVSQGLILCLVGMMTLGLFLPPRQAVAVETAAPWWRGLSACAHGIAYGGFNMALAAPSAALSGGKLPPDSRKKCMLLVSLALAALLCCANGTLLRHTALRGESLPFVQLMKPLGKPGYFLCCAALYLAVLTTLTGTLRGLGAIFPGKKSWAMLALSLTALAGFEEIVGAAYPLLGGICFLLLVCANDAPAPRRGVQ